MNRKSKFRFSIGILLIIIGLVLGMHGSIHYRDISPLPLSLGLTILFISLFAEFGRRRPLGSEGISYGNWKILAILFAFAVTLIIIGVIVPLIWG